MDTLEWTVAAMSECSTSANHASTPPQYSGHSTPPNTPLTDTHTADPALGLAVFSIELSASATATIMLPVLAGRIVRVLNKDGSGWWQGEVDDWLVWSPENHIDPAPDASNQDQEHLISESSSTFPANQLSTPARVLDALRFTDWQEYYVSVISTFIQSCGDSASQRSASDILLLHDIITEIAEYGSNLLTNLDTLIQHHEISTRQLHNLKTAKEGQYNAIRSLVKSLHLLTLFDTSELEEQILLLEAVTVLKAGADSVAAILNTCLSLYRHKQPATLDAPHVVEFDDISRKRSKVEKSLTPITRLGDSLSSNAPPPSSYPLIREKAGKKEDKENVGLILTTLPSRPGSSQTRFSGSSRPSWTLAEEVDRLRCRLETAMIKEGENDEGCYNAVAAVLAARTSVSTYRSSTSATDYGSIYFARRLTSSTSSTRSPSRSIIIANSAAQS